MDGATLARTARLLDPNLTVLLMSGYLDITLPHDVTLLRKPFTPSELFGAIDQALAVSPCAR
jgi:hypothetical protein